jgi:mono/diheme cytochrome c family protein
VLVRGDDVYVTQFRSAELLHLKLDGTMVERHAPPSFATDEFVIDANNQARMERVASRPTTAWRLLDIPGKGTTILHERARGGEVQVQPGGYGAGQCGSGIVQTSITFGMDTGRALSTDITDAALAIDMAADPEGILLAIVSAGNWGSSNQLHLYTLSAVDQVLAQTPPTDSVPDSANDAGVSAGGTGGSIAGMIPGSNNCVGAERTMDSSVGHAVAVTFVSPYEIAVQEREPAGISFFDVRTNQLRARLDLDQPSRFDTGHAIFHLRASSGIACASCHAEAGDDSHVWRFHGIGARRTQSLRGGILGTEPLHWNGDMKDFPTLVQEVFVGRMSGFSPSAEQSTALARWIDRQPALVATARDAKSAERGQALFESEAVGCATCHDGTHLTNNKFAEVGTGAMFQVPSLRGVSFRMPLMHDGCANTLLQRFDSVCGGGDKHGHTSQLDKAQVADLVSYLETL